MDYTVFAIIGLLIYIKFYRKVKKWKGTITQKNKNNQKHIRYGILKIQSPRLNGMSKI